MAFSYPNTFVFLAAGLLCACDGPTAGLKAPSEEPRDFEPVDVSALPEPTDPVLAKGREVYLEACERCHRIGKAGAPRTGDSAAWEPRREQGLATLFAHAIDGFESPSGNEMPARGGKKSLSDDDIKAAVQFMVQVEP